MSHRPFVSVACVACALWSRPCLAADPAPGPAEAPSVAKAQSADTLPVSIKLVSSKIQAEDIRAAIEDELRVGVRVVDTPADEGLSVAVKGRRATVSYRSKKGETARSLDLPANTVQAVEVIALLAGNLARDEASELLARLAPPPSESAAATSAETTPPADTPVPEAVPAPAPATKAPEKKAAPAPAKPPPARPPADELIRDSKAANVSLFYPKTLLQNTERRVLKLELGAAYSRVGAVELFGFTFGYLRVDHHVRGFVGAFGHTRVNGEVRGVQMGGFFTEGHAALHGVELGLLGALRWGNVEGVQVSGFFSRAKDVRGVQVSGGVDWAADVSGVQAALVTVARDVDGAQLNLVGVARDVDGAQLGLVNVAKSTDLQIGLVNVAERVDGAAIGLVSIAGNGYIEPTAYAIGGSRGSYNAGMKFVAGLAYTVLAAGTTGTGSDARFRSEFGGGLHVEPPFFRDGPVVDRAALELGAHVANIYRPTSEQDGSEEALHARVGLGVRFARTFWAFGGYDVSTPVSPFAKNIGQGPWAGVAIF